MANTANDRRDDMAAAMRSAPRAATQVGRPVGLSATDRGGPWPTTRSGTWRARPC